MFRLFSHLFLNRTRLIAVLGGPRQMAQRISRFFRPWRGRGIWVVFTVVTLAWTSPTGQLLGGYATAPSQEEPTPGSLGQLIASGPEVLQTNRESFPVHLRQQGVLQADRQEAALSLETTQTPKSYIELARLDVLSGQPESALELLRESLDRHEQASMGASVGWGAPAEMAASLSLMVPLESALGRLEDARRHANHLFELDIEGRQSGMACLPLLQLVQRHDSAQETLDTARRCEERDSYLAEVLGAVYRGEAELALGRPSAAKSALQDAEAAHLRLIADLGPNLDERSYARAAELALAQLRGKWNLLVGEADEGTQQLRRLVDRLRLEEGLEGWLAGHQRLQEVRRLADRTGELSLSIASTRALEAQTPRGLGWHETSSGDSLAHRDVQMASGPWVVWTER